MIHYIIINVAISLGSIVLEYFKAHKEEITQILNALSNPDPVLVGYLEQLPKIIENFKGD